MSEQKTLTGGTADSGRERPKTLVFDYDAGEWILRRNRFDRGISTAAADRLIDPTESDESSDGSDDSDASDDDPERAGAFYTVQLSYTVERRFTIPAWSDHEAEERAELLSDVGGELVHTRTTEGSTIWSDDEKLPDEWRPEYSSEPLWEVYGGEDE